MLNSIQEFVASVLPGKKKTASNGWISFNAVCCPHNGQSQDKRGRGGIILNADGAVSYHCFNCNFKAHYQPGFHLNYKFRKLLSWFGVSENETRRLVIEALRIKELVSLDDIALAPKEDVKFEKRELPEGALALHALNEFYTLRNTGYPETFSKLVEYIYGRKIDLVKYDFYWNEESPTRLVIPYFWKGEVVGYTARALGNQKPKYINHNDPGYVFNIDKQHKDWKFVLVSEGTFDAMSLDGVAVLHNEVNEKQADIIDSLGKEVVVVPDFDKHVNEQGKEEWPGEDLIDAAIEYGWSVSYPVWRETCKDINEAVAKYGKLFVMKSVIDGIQRSKLKIELMKRL